MYASTVKIRYGSVITILFTSLIFIFNPDDALDITRYYQEVNSQELSTPLIDYIRDCIARRGDFVYYTSLFLCRKIGIPLDVQTFVYLYIYIRYSQKIVYLYCKNYLKSDNYLTYVQALMCFSIPFVYVFSISRMVAAFGFVFIAIYKFLNKKYSQSIIFLIIAIFTHLGSAIYIFILLLLYCFIVPLIKNKRYFLFVFIGTIVVVVLASEVLLFSIRTIPIFNSLSYYSKYLEINSLSFEGQSTITVIGTLFYALIYSIFSFLNRQYNKIASLSAFFTVIILLSISMSNMFLQRTLMFSLPFWGILVVSNLNSFPKSQIACFIMPTYLQLFIMMAVLVAYYKLFIFL